MRIQVNGEHRVVEAATILALVEELGLDVRKVAVERNLEIVPRSLHATTALADGDRVELVQDWTSNRATLKRALNRLTTGMFTHFNDALFLAAREQLEKISGRKAIIVLTDGIDSGRGAIRFEQAFRAVVEEEVPVYVLSKTRIQSTLEQEQLQFYRQSPSALNQLKIDGIRLTLTELEASERNLTRLAAETGGRIFLPDRFDQLDAVYQQVADELRSQYVIFYTPTDAVRDGRYRAIRVRLKTPRLHVTTRFGYYAR